MNRNIAEVQKVKKIEVPEKVVDPADEVWDTESDFISPAKTFEPTITQKEKKT